MDPYTSTLQQVTNGNLLGPNKPPKETCWRVLVVMFWVFGSSSISVSAIRHAKSPCQAICLRLVFVERKVVRCPEETSVLGLQLAQKPQYIQNPGYINIYINICIGLQQAVAGSHSKSPEDFC